jgi:uncharacterized protein (DUF1499 family)
LWFVLTKVLPLVALAGLGLVLGGLLSNRVPLTKPPGLEKRLATYLTKNVAETSEDAAFPELRLRRYPVSADRLYEVTQRAVAALGWRLSATSDQRKTLGAVVTSPLWRFKDDVTARAVPEGPQASALHIRSRSRIGKGDLGANLRHVLDLQAAVDRALTARP